MWTAIALIPVGYLLGMFPSAGIVAKARGVDITKEGSGNPGASNVMRVVGWRFGAIVMAWSLLNRRWIMSILKSWTLNARPFTFTCWR